MNGVCVCAGGGGASKADVFGGMYKSPSTARDPYEGEASKDAPFGSKRSSDYVAQSRKSVASAIQDARKVICS